LNVGVLVSKLGADGMFGISGENFLGIEIDESIYP
jgi:hypothetical protein